MDKLPEAPKDHVMVSLALLLEEHFELEHSLFARQLDEIFPGAFLPKNDDCFVAEVEERYQLMVKSLVPGHSGMFFVMSIPKPYGAYPVDESIVSDPAFLAQVRRHRAWLSVDRVMDLGSVEENYRFIGKVLAYLAPKSTIAVLHPQSVRLVEFEESCRAALTSDDVLGSFGFPKHER